MMNSRDKAQKKKLLFLMLGLSAATVVQGATLTTGNGLKERGDLRISPRAQSQGAVANNLSQKKARSTKARKGSPQKP